MPSTPSSGKGQSESSTPKKPGTSTSLPNLPGAAEELGPRQRALLSASLNRMSGRNRSSGGKFGNKVFELVRSKRSKSRSRGESGSPTGSSSRRGSPSARYKLTDMPDIWKRIFEDEHRRGGSSHTKLLESQRDIRRKSSNEYVWHSPSIDSGENLVVLDPDPFSSMRGSISAGPITLETGFDHVEPETPRKCKCLSKCSSWKCTCKVDQYTKSCRAFAKASTKIESYYKSCKPILVHMTRILNLAPPPKLGDDSDYEPLPEGANKVGAQLWLVTMGLTKIFRRDVDFKLEKSLGTSIRNEYIKLSKLSISLIPYFRAIEVALGELETGGNKPIREMKRNMTGSPDNDLTSVDPWRNYVDYDGKKPTTDPNHKAKITTIAHLLNLDMSYEAGRGHGHRLHQHNLHHGRGDHFDGWDLFEHDGSLNHRTRIDIFVRVWTDTAWFNFETKLSISDRLQCYFQMLRDGVQRLKDLRSFLPALRQKLQMGSNSSQFFCRPTCLACFKEMEHQLNLITETSSFSIRDFDPIRRHLCSAEAKFQRILDTCKRILGWILDIIKVSQICCEFIQQVPDLRLPSKCSDRSKMITAWLSSRENSGANDERTLMNSPSFGARTFYFQHYATILKTTPLPYGLYQFILQNSIPMAHKHSGVDFDGPRFINVPKDK